VGKLSTSMKYAFGATEVFRLEDPGGSVVARLSVDGAEFWVIELRIVKDFQTELRQF
jgi:hypothetical protein